MGLRLMFILTTSTTTQRLDLLRLSSASLRLPSRVPTPATLAAIHLSKTSPRQISSTTPMSPLLSMIPLLRRTRTKVLAISSARPLLRRWVLISRRLQTQSIRDIKRSLNIGEPAKPVVSMTVSKRVESTVTSTTVFPPQRFATSVLLQGNARRATKNLWMIPDGGGSATSYVDIPDLSSDVAVFGLNSPYMKVPEEYKCGVIGMASAFITEMQRRQPTGPYMLAGWSAGGVIAFEAVNQLTKAGETVEKLILIDSPCPDIIEPLPSSLHRWFASIGPLGDGDFSKLPAWLLPHFAASVNALSNYSAEIIDPEKSPHVTAIWCEDGVCKLPSDPRPDPFPYGHAQFLLDNRTDFGPNLWDKYLNPKKFECKHLPGNHFSMMKKPYVGTLGDIIRDAMNAVV